MNRFWIIWMVLLVSYCNCQWDLLMLTSDNDTENAIRCDMYLRKRSNQLKYIWAIHNFSIHEKLDPGEIASPDLHASTTDRPEWYIKVTPHGIDRKNKTISLDVYLSNTYEVEEALAKYTISIINNKKQVLYSRNSTKFMKFQAECGHGWPDFCKKDKFFRNQLLQNDTLILLIHITWIFEGPFNEVSLQRKISSCDRLPKTVGLGRGITQDTAENVTRCDTYLDARPQEIKYIWAIHNFSVHEANSEREILSLSLQAPIIRDSYLWDLKIRPNDTYNGKETISLGIEVFAPMLDGQAFAEINVSMINYKKETLFSTNTKFSIDESIYNKTWEHFCTKDDFFRNQILQNDTLILAINIRWINGLFHDESYHSEIISLAE